MALASLLLSACLGGDLPQTCEDLPEVPAVGACFGNPGLEYPGYGTADLAVTGTVTSVTTGPFPDACDVSFSAVWGSGAEGLILVVTDADGVETTVGLAAPGLDSPVEEGDRVSLDLAYVFGDFGPDRGRVVLADEAGVEQLVISVAGTLADLATPADVTLDQGDPICTQHDECGAWSAFDFWVTTADDQGVVAYGDEEDIGPWRVVHAGDEQQTPETSSGCPDWFVAHVAAAFVRE
ncbi:MAG: hypothetical protein V4850_10980 [Myxococcota bacterium]